MQILELPTTQNDMVAKISLKGITHIKAGRYKKRHYGCKEVYETPRAKFYTKQEYKKLFPKEFISKAKKKSRHDTAQKPPKKKREHSYKIDKNIVSTRLQTFTATQPGEKQLYFWTITFPINTSEEEGHRLFNIWLTRCRSELNLRSYLWVKERQKNNTIHFHLAIHQRLSVKIANRYMRATIMHSIDDGSINWSRTAAVKYNGVDIAKDRKTKRVVNFAKGKKAKALQVYLTKYVTKNNGTFQQLAWHCSRDYSNLVVSFALTRGELIEWQLFRQVNRATQFENDYFTSWYWYKTAPPKIIRYLTDINSLIRDLLV